MLLSLLITPVIIIIIVVVVAIIFHAGGICIDYVTAGQTDASHVLYE